MKIKTHKNFERTISILENQLGYSCALSYKIARKLFDIAKEHRVDGKYTKSIDDFLVRIPHIDTLGYEFPSLLKDVCDNPELIVDWVESHWDFSYEISYFGDKNS